MIRRTVVALAVLVGGAMLGTDAAASETLTLTDGAREATLGDLAAGEPAIVHLWATWCAPCLEELPELTAAASADRALAEALLVISVDTRPFAEVRSFLDERLGLDALTTWQVVDGNAGAALGVRGYPSTIVLGADGTARRTHTGPVDWRHAAVRRELLAAREE